jgi:hypothetical protein
MKYPVQGESKKTDTFVIHLNIKLSGFFDSPCTVQEALK